MSFDLVKLYSLLPPIYRVRDSDQGEPIKELLSIIAEQIAILEEDLAQLYDDQFIETCAEWVIPYIGDLIGVRGIHSLTGSALTPAFSYRAQVANTIAYRRRKGTASVLEQLARDVTNWDARVVEFFHKIATTQYMNHLRPGNLYSPDLRDWETLEWVNTPFEKTAHTVDVRHISSRRGKYNIPNIGIFLWRLKSYSRTDSPAFKVDERRYMFSPLGNNTILYNKPVPEDAITHIAEPMNVPIAISRRILAKYPQMYYGPNKSFNLKAMNGKGVIAEIPQDMIAICDLSDLKDGSWAHMKDASIEKLYAIDPVLGRLLVPSDSTDVTVSFHYGFSANMGGGEYERADSFIQETNGVIKVPTIKFPKIQDALNNTTNGGTVEIEGNGLHVEDLTIKVNKSSSVELCSSNSCFPFIKGTILIEGGKDSEVTLSGLLIGDGNDIKDRNMEKPKQQQLSLRITGELAKLRLCHCTLVPGISLSQNGTPLNENPSIVTESSNTLVEIDKCIVGGLRVNEDAMVHITNSIVDASEDSGVVFAGIDNLGPGGSLRVENCTIIGKVHAHSIDYASNSIFMARYNDDNDAWEINKPQIQPIHAERLQQGCVRFCYLPTGSRVPRRYRCQPDGENRAGKLLPQFTSIKYGEPGYCQLSQNCAVEIRQGADDGSEMGAFHDLYQPQRETNLRVRLDEYIRFGLEAGIFYES